MSILATCLGYPRIDASRDRKRYLFGNRAGLLEDFAQFRYPNRIGPGVYDIHSPRVSAPEEIAHLLIQVGKVLPIQQLWVNPDCGLKTRGWAEVERALTNMVNAGRQTREHLSEVPR